MREITRVFDNAKRIEIDGSSKLFMMSDVHRGIGKKSDDFAHNHKLYLKVIKEYYKNEFTYIELGDGEELWENRDIKQIIRTYLDVYLQFKKFYDKDRLYFIYGNHDKQKQSDLYVKSNLYQYYDEEENTYKDLFKGLKTHEALVLDYKEIEGNILLLHGHQADLINNQLWHITRFLVRHLWRHLEHIGVQDPTRTSKVRKRLLAIERKLTDWLSQNNHMIISGHTHKPMFSDIGIPAYFNDGCCVNKDGITSIEIENGAISLVKWSENKEGRIQKEVLAMPVHLSRYFNQSLYEQKTTA